MICIPLNLTLLFTLKIAQFLIYDENISRIINISTTVRDRSIKIAMISISEEYGKKRKTIIYGMNGTEV